MATGNQNIQRSMITATVLPGNTDLAILTDAGYGVRVTNNNGVAPLFFTVSHPGGDNTAPTINGVNTQVVASVAGDSVAVRHDGQFGSVVQLVSAGSVQYTISILGSGANL